MTSAFGNGLALRHGTTVDSLAETDTWRHGLVSPDWKNDGDATETSGDMSCSCHNRACNHDWRNTMMACASRRSGKYSLCLSMLCIHITSLLVHTQTMLTRLAGQLYRRSTVRRLVERSAPDLIDLVLQSGSIRNATGIIPQYAIAAGSTAQTLMAKPTYGLQPRVMACKSATLGERRARAWREVLRLGHVRRPERRIRV